ncbi:DUF4129 domain-containing protein [Halorhabdus sp. CBA1104]|uniref:transglutaminase TgpA family protein n=1 Tax=Halorhabdus sp. CBA1104 TaxID=1380432 RepID=UPI0012B25F5F|nr:DUF3488 and transglutaminase-like domain-containing protein [Halorhabdus sp. CBA1104]QGN05968.1 DUF4129 domain-containing protein [Halorhabdus sp. CBA1104]
MRIADRAGRSPVRLIALAAGLVVISSFVGVLYHVIDVISDPGTVLVSVVLALGGATLLARYLRLRHAVGLAVGLFSVGMGWYLTQLGTGSLDPWPHVRYTIALLTGQSVLGIVNLEAWVLAVTPAPVFLTWYLAVRRRYVASAVVGGGTLTFFVLTGDAAPTLTLLGVVGVVALVGLGDLDRFGGSVGDADVVGTVIALAIIVSATVTVVPTGLAYTFSPDTGLQSPAGGGDASAGTLEGNVLNVDNSLSIAGSLELSPKVRFRVEGDSPEYWRVNAFNVYTGDGWVRRGNTGPLDRRLSDVPGRNRSVSQTYTVVSQTRAMPAVWRPTAVDGPAASAARVTRLGGLQPERALTANETYRVESAIPVATLRELRTAGRSYPQTVEEMYLQLPDSTPERVVDRTDRLTGNADNPYDTARVIEQWLERNRAYSLNVSKPSGSIADAFLFEMERGYCTYYATTMTVMLRSQGIPARMVVGYTSGQRVEQNEWVVRGQNAHAWTEMYVPDVGWVRFDPTPAAPREEAEQGTLETARQNNASNVDTAGSDDGEWTPTPTPTPTPIEQNGTESNLPPDFDIPTPPGGPGRGNTVTVDTGGQTQTAPRDGSDDDDETAGIPFEIPTAEQTALGALAVIGVAGMARRSGVTQRAYRALWLRFQPRTDPTTDVERAFERLEYVLAREYRERRTGETVRAYLTAIDASERVRRVAALRERVRYGGEIDDALAEEAVELVDDIVTE